MAIEKKLFGKNADGRDVTCYTMTNASGASVSMIDYGAIVTSIRVPDVDGTLDDIALGFDDMAGYLAEHGNMGETIGRYGNRIAGARFSLDGKTYTLAANDGANHLHGGMAGFGVRMWEVAATEHKEFDTLSFHRVSADGEEGYPGELDVRVDYSWTENCDLMIRYRATTNKPTLCNLTNHLYFNLAGHDSGSAEEQVIYIDSDAVTAVDDGLIPVYFRPVALTAFDLREGKALGDGLREGRQDAQMIKGHGYDHNYVLRKGSAFGLAAAVHDERSGRTMEVLTDQPGIQFYSGNYLNYSGKGGAVYGPHAGFCLETQHYPDSPNQSRFPATVLRPGEVYDTTTIYAFRVDA